MEGLKKINDEGERGRWGGDDGDCVRKLKGRKGVENVNVRMWGR